MRWRPPGSSAAHRHREAYRWLLVTHQGSVGATDIEGYLRQFVFRFDRRSFRRRGMLIHRLLELAVTLEPVGMRWRGIPWLACRIADQLGLPATPAAEHRARARLRDRGRRPPRAHVKGASMKKRVVERASIAGSPEEVRPLVTDPRHVETWYAFGGADIDVRPGGAMSLRWDEHGVSNPSSNR